MASPYTPPDGDAPSTTRGLPTRLRVATRWRSTSRPGARTGFSPKGHLVRLDPPGDYTEATLVALEFAPGEAAPPDTQFLSTPSGIGVCQRVPTTCSWPRSS